MTEIKEAIRALSPEQRVELADDLSEILPELNGDSAWRRIIDDPRPSKALDALAAEIHAQMAKDPNAYPLVTEDEFDKHS